MEIDVVAPAELSVEDAQAWSTLQDGARGERAVLGSPFLSPQWARACAAAPGPDRGEARVAVLRQDGVAAGFFPVRVARATAMPLGAPMCDYQGLVAAPGIDIDPARLVRRLGVSRLDFSSLAGDPTGFAPFRRGEADSHVIDLSEGHDAYAAGRRAAGSDILQDTAKKKRKLEREHGEACFVALDSDPAAFDTLIAWKRAQYHASGQTDIFEAGWTRALLQHLFERPDPEFGGALFTLQVGGRLAAAHFALRRRDVLHAWFIAHDEAFARYSPGVVLICDILKWAAGEGVRELDLGPGAYRFKQSLANLKRPVAHGYVGRPSPAALARGLAYRLRDTAEALPLGRFSALPGKAMRRLDLIRSL